MNEPAPRTIDIENPAPAGASVVRFDLKVVVNRDYMFRIACN
jgi:hypothetical protein